VRARIWLGASNFFLCAESATSGEAAVAGGGSLVIGNSLKDEKTKGLKASGWRREGDRF
jgi:hypothetical protein